MQNLFKINLIAIFMIIFWGSAYVGIRAGLVSYSPGALALLRYLVASFCMLIIYWTRFRKFKPLNLRDFISVFLLGILGFTVYNIALNYGEITVTAGIASFVISQIPVLITILAVIFFNERLKWLGWIGTLISFCGIGLIALSKSQGFHIDIGIIYIFIAAITGSVYSLLQKSLLKRLNPIEFTALAIWSGTFGLLIYLPALLHQIPKASLHDTLTVIYIGIFPAAIAYLMWGYILSYLPTTKAASYLYIVPLLTVIIGWIWLKEIPHWLAITGGIMALCGAFLVNRNVIRKHP